MTTRLYSVTAIIGAQEKKYLIDASNNATAIRHVAKKHIQATIASGKDVAELMSKGVTMESAVPESQPGLDIPVTPPDPNTIL